MSAKLPIKTADNKRGDLIKAADTADYVQAMVRSLAKMTADHGLAELSQILENTAEEAVQVAARLSRLIDLDRGVVPAPRHRHPARKALPESAPPSV